MESAEEPGSGRARPAFVYDANVLYPAQLRDGSVEEYRRHANELTLPDESDRYVLAAAIEVEARHIDRLYAFMGNDFLVDLLPGRPVGEMAIVESPSGAYRRVESG